MGPRGLPVGGGPVPVHGGGALGWFHVILWFVIWVLAILVVAWGTRELFRHLGSSRRAGPPAPSPAITELELRYARGEVTREEYLTRRADLLGGYLPPGASPPAV